MSAARSRARVLVTWREQLDGLLLENAGKPARERLTLIRIFEELRALGYEGSYDAVRRYAKGWRAERGASFSVTFAGTPGKANCPGQSVSALVQQYGGLNNAAGAQGFPSVQALQNATMEYCA